MREHIILLKVMHQNAEDSRGDRRDRYGDTKIVQEKSDSELYQSYMDSADQVDRLENAQVLTGLLVASHDRTERAYLCYGIYVKVLLTQVIVGKPPPD